VATIASSEQLQKDGVDVPQGKTPDLAGHQHPG